MGTTFMETETYGVYGEIEISEPVPQIELFELARLCETLAVKQADRRTTIKQINKQRQSVEAFVAHMILGYSNALDGEVRKGLYAKARTLVNYASRGKEFPAYVDDLDMPREEVREVLSGPAELLNRMEKGFEQKKAEIEEELQEIIPHIPVWAWLCNVPGVAENLAAGVLGEAVGYNTGYPGVGLAQFSTPAKYRKWMGMFVNEFGNAGHVGADPQRRSIVWNVVQSLIKRGDTPYRRMYDEKKGEYARRAIDNGILIYTFHKDTPGNWVDRGYPKPERVKSQSEIDHIPEDERISSGQIDDRAWRYVGFKFLKHLWQAWNDLSPEGDLTKSQKKELGIS